MPRRNHVNKSHRSSKQERRSGQGSFSILPRDGASLAGTREEFGPSWSREEIFLVRRMGASQATKFYVCPGCNQNIPPGVRHTVAWPKDAGHGPDDRRHWHDGCWARR